MNKKSYGFDEIKLGDFNIDLNGETDDIFIIAASFEERGTAVVSYLKDDYKCKNAIIYYNEDNCNYSKNLALIKEHLKQRSENELVVKEGSHRNIQKKNEIMTEIAEYCKKHVSEETANIAVDITSFSRIDLIILLDYLVSYIENVKIKLIYVSPEGHGEWLSKGYSEISNIAGFCGGFDVLKPTALIILSGFEKERPMNLIEAYEPQEVFLGFSNPAVQEAFGERNANSQAELSNFPNVQQFNFSARDIKECCDNIEGIIKEKIIDYNIVLAPLCTKLTAVACFLLAKKYPEIQLVYCYPQEYNYETYSIGMSKLFVEYLDDICS